MYILINYCTFLHHLHMYVCMNYLYGMELCPSSKYLVWVFPTISYICIYLNLEYSDAFQLSFLVAVDLPDALRGWHRAPRPASRQMHVARGPSSNPVCRTCNPRWRVSIRWRRWPTKWNIHEQNWTTLFSLALAHLIGAEIQFRVILCIVRAQNACPLHLIRVDVQWHGLIWLVAAAGTGVAVICASATTWSGSIGLVAHIL